MHQVWRADASGWWARCEPDAYGQKPFVVRITAHGELQFGNGPRRPLLSWQAEGIDHDTSFMEKALSGRIAPFMPSAPSPESACGETLSLSLSNSAARVELSVTCFPALGVLRVEGSITATQQTANLTACRWQWAVPIPAGDDIQPVQLHRIQGVRLAEQGSFPVSFLQVNQPLRRGPLVWGADHPHAAAHPTSSNMWLPWLATTDTAGIGAVFGLHWSGLWQARAEWVDGSVTEGISGYTQVDFSSSFARNLESGDVVQLPAAFVTYTTTGLPSASQQTHAYIRSTVLAPGEDDAMPWVQFNSWYPWRAKLQDSEMEKQLSFAAQLGFEVFVLDDGWFLGGYEGAPWGAGAGLWKEAPAKFPAGIKAFADKVHANNMKFGLWIEPERVDSKVLPDTGIELSWLAGGDDNIPFSPHKSGSGQQLCFGCPESVAWAKRQVDRLAGEYGADWIKWDHNRYQVCTRSDHGHQAGDGNRAHILGVYAVLRYLLKRYPHVVVENCAAGGTRVDYGLMEYTHLTWLHDIPSPSYRARSQFTGAALAYPPEYLNAWVVPDSWEPLNDENARFKLRSCMLGAFGISYPLYGLPPQVLSIIKEEIASYKQLRPLIKRGLHTALLPQPTSLAAWSAHAYILSADEQQTDGRAVCGTICGAVLTFRGNSQAGSYQRLTIPGLLPDGKYRVVDQDSQKEWVLSGAELAARGLEITLCNQNSSAVLWLLRA